MPAASGSKLAKRAREEIVDLVAHRHEGADCDFGALAERQDGGGVLLGTCSPVAVGTHAGEIGGDVFGVDADFAAAILLAADGVDDGLDHRAQFIVGRHRDRDDAVAVEVFRRVELGEVGHVGNADVLAFAETKVGDDLARRAGELGAFRVAGVDGVERHAVAGREQQRGVLEHGGDPARRGDDLGAADLAVTIAVEHLQRAGIEFQPGGRTAQHRPQLLIEFMQMFQIGGRIDAHLVETARAVKTPAMRRRACFLIHDNSSFYLREKCTRNGKRARDCNH